MNKIPCILLVDDDETTNYVNSLVIKKSGKVEEIQIAQNGKEALEIIRNRYEPEGASDIPLLVLLDINMPIMNGLEFMKHFDALENRIKAKVSVVVLTTSSHLRDLETMGRFGVQGFINKPLQMKELEKVVVLH